jgi:hypothetical protein
MNEIATILISVIAALGIRELLPTILNQFFANKQADRLTHASELELLRKEVADKQAKQETRLDDIDKELQSWKAKYWRLWAWTAELVAKYNVTASEMGRPTVSMPPCDDDNITGPSTWTSPLNTPDTKVPDPKAP